MISHLGIAWQATPIAAIEPDEFYDFQVTRPVVEITNGQIDTKDTLVVAWSKDGTVVPWTGTK